ncbi:MAG: endonuclease/exonuclease/phosphatase family protein [Nocardioides sp.]
MRFVRSVLVAGLVVVGLVVTGLRLAEPDSGPGLLVTSFTPIGLVVWLLVAAHAWFRTVLGPRRRRWGVAAVALALPVGLHAWWLSPAYVGPQPPPAAGATPFRVMTANLLANGGDGIDLVRVAVKADADLLVVEEVTADQLADMESAGLGDLFPHRVGEPGAGLEGTMVLSAYPLSDTVEVPLPLGGWLTTAATPDGPVRVLGAHPHPPTLDGEDWRSDQALLRAAAAGADVVAGDLNSTPDHVSLLRLADDGLHSAAEVAHEGWQPTWPAWGSRRVLGVPLPPLVPIDHVLVGRRVAVLDVGTRSVAGSDHRAVVATLALT